MIAILVGWLPGKALLGFHVPCGFIEHLHQLTRGVGGQHLPGLESALQDINRAADHGDFLDQRGALLLTDGGLVLRRRRVIAKGHKTPNEDLEQADLFIE